MYVAHTVRYHLHDSNTNLKVGLVFSTELNSDSRTHYDAVIHRGAAMQLLLCEMLPQGFAYNLAVNVVSRVSFQWHTSKWSQPFSPAADSSA